MIILAIQFVVFTSIAVVAGGMVADAIEVMTKGGK